MRMISSNQIEEVVVFTVPYLIPPSGNHYKQPCKYIGKDGQLHSGQRVTKDAKAYKDAVAIFAQGRTVAPLDALKKKTAYDVVITVVLGKGQRGDEDNFHKVGLDALVYAGVIHSDAYAHCVIHVIRNERGNPRTNYLIRRAT
jgi:Holliday junction resolvase RusA-like endonuclease